MVWLRWFGLAIALAWSCQGWANETRPRSGIADCPGPGCPAHAPSAPPTSDMKSGSGQGAGSHGDKSMEKKEEKKEEKKASKKKNE